MSLKVTNAIAFLIASVGMAFAFLGAVGTEPTFTAHHQHTDKSYEETKR
jgi:dipeptide/tripeptide permease